MKNTLKLLFPVLLTVLYLVASVGVGVHKCDTDGTSTVVLLIKDAACEDVHNHDNTSCLATACNEHHHDHNCCHTELHHLEQGYDVVQPMHKAQTDQLTLLACFIVPVNSNITEDNQFNSSDFLNGGPPILIHKKFHSYFAQWRL